MSPQPKLNRLLPLAACLITLMAVVMSGCNAPSSRAVSGADGNPVEGLPGGEQRKAQACQVPPASPPVPGLDDPHTWAADVLDYLNNGGLLTTLLESLESRQTGLQADQTGAVIDLNADGWEDFALVLTRNDPATGLSSGMLFVFICDEREYDLAYVSPPGDLTGLPSIVSTSDLNDDGVPELLISVNSCGAHTCFLDLRVLSYSRGEFRNLLQGRSDDLPNPTIDLRGPAADGYWSLAVTGTGISSAGAGPYRERTRVWTWDSEAGAFIHGPDALGAPRFRIHLLHDADTAAQAGDYELALELYTQVIEDGRYDDWIYGETGARTLAAFAAFRQMSIHLNQGNTGAARRALEFMQASATNDTADMLSLAEVTFEAYENAGLEASCSAAQAYGAAHAAGVLEPLNYGYANRAYSAPDLCLSPQ
jgi:hypothetical protein